MSYQVCEPLYTLNRTSSKKKNVNQGGTSSAKTYTILQVLFDIALEDAGCVITIAGQDIPNLKKGAIRDAAKIVASSAYIQSRILSYNKSDRIYEFTNGSIIEFNSYSDEQDAKSGKRDYLFVNEANGISYEIYFQLSIRTKKKEFIDYNPTAKFWVHEKLIGNENVRLFISDHRHNQFLLKEQHDEIEAIPDKELWKVYARGLTGKITGLIYPNARLIDEMPELFRKTSVLGLDFGYNHKTALVEVAHNAKRLFWDEWIYQAELTIGDLIQLMKPLNIGRKPIYADHAAADKIEDLLRAGYNVIKADKDVLNGIDFVKRNDLYVTKRSSGLRKELLTYKWKVDKNGARLDEPVKFNDDACFTADTLITTNRGKIPIIDITVKDKVLTSSGYKQVLKTFDNGCKEIREYVINTLYLTIKIKCTPCHKIKTTQGWKCISDLQEKDSIFLASTLTGRPTGGIKAGLTLPATKTHYTGRYGNSTMVKYQKALKSTTLKKTPTKTTLKTLSCCHSMNTSVCTDEKRLNKIRNGLKIFNKKASQQHRYGIAAKKAGHGIITTQKQQPRMFTKKVLPKHASSVAAISKHPLLARIQTDFVPVSAKANGEGMRDLIISKKSACNVNQNSLLINTINQSSAQAVAVRSITGTPKGKAQVYDLCVEGKHEYFANGVLVHNCDAGRYGSYSHFRNIGKSTIKVAEISTDDRRNPLDWV